MNANVPAPTSEVLLADGSAAEIRRLVPADRAAVTALFDSCSDANLYTRFFTVGHSVVERHIDHLFAADGGPIAYLLTMSGRLVGIADVEPCAVSTDEIAFLVADDAHGLGVATLLLERAAEEAHAAGVVWFAADVLAVNHPMLEVFADAGFTIEQHADRGDVALRMSTEATSAVRTAMETRHAHAVAQADR